MVDVMRPLRLDGTIDGQALAADALRAAQNREACSSVVRALRRRACPR